MSDALGVFDSLRDYLFRYYDTPFSVRDERVQEERRALLDQDAVTWREPWLEVLRDYALNDETLSRSALRAAARTRDLADVRARGLIPPRSSALPAPAEALKAVIGGKNMVITAGTGSGKTEAFLLPVVNALLASPRAWQPLDGTARNRWWRGTARVRRRSAKAKTGVARPCGALSSTR